MRRPLDNYKVLLYPAYVFSVQKSLKGSCNPIRFSVYLSASNACTWFGFPVLSILVQIWLSQRTFFGMLPTYSAFLKKKKGLILSWHTVGNHFTNFIQKKTTSMTKVDVTL